MGKIYIVLLAKQYFIPSKGGAYFLTSHKIKKKKKIPKELVLLSGVIIIIAINAILSRSLYRVLCNITSIPTVLPDKTYQTHFADDELAIFSSSPGL